MFNSNLVVAVKVNGKVLREFDGIVALPFGSEYSIYIKNTSMRRASVNISIDGTDVLDGMKLIVNGNSDIELKRFVKNGNMNIGNAFKFIEKTAKIEEFRGNKAEDGLLTLTYAFERDLYTNPYPPYNTYYTTTTSYRNMVDSGRLGGNISDNSSALRSATKSAPMSNSDRSAFYNANVDFTGSLNTNTTISASCVAASDTIDWSVISSNYADNVPKPQTAGVTAPGSKVDQRFKMVNNFITDGKQFTMTLQMVGETADNKKVKEPVVVKRNVRCSMCGTTTRQTAKFCHECGAGLEIV